MVVTEPLDLRRFSGLVSGVKVYYWDWVRLSGEK